jgi:hypothetical protein
VPVHETNIHFQRYSIRTYRSITDHVRFYISRTDRRMDSLKSEDILFWKVSWLLQRWEISSVASPVKCVVTRVCAFRTERAGISQAGPIGREDQNSKSIHHA